MIDEVLMDGMNAAIFCLLLLSFQAHARDWTGEEIGWGAAAAAVRLADWAHIGVRFDF